MVHKVLADAVLGASLLLTSSLASPSAPMHPGQTIQKIQDYVYVVKAGDTIKDIAKENYGSEDYWTTIWNDNPDIADPEVIHADDKLTLRFRPPMVVAYLDESLQKRFDELHTPTHASVSYEYTGTPVQITEAFPSPISAPQPQPIVQSTSGALSEAQISYLGNCESGMTATRNSGNGYYGAFQFSPGTWRSMNTGYERADMAPLEVQKDAVQRLLARSSINTQFPGCSRKMQAEGLL